MDGRYGEPDRKRWKWGYLLLVSPILLIIGSQISSTIINAVAMQVARYECNAQEPVEIVNQRLWDMAAAAAIDPNYYNRNEYRFQILLIHFDDLKQDWLKLAIYRFRAPIKVQSNIAAFENNIYVYSIFYKKCNLIVSLIIDLIIKIVH